MRFWIFVGIFPRAISNFSCKTQSKVLMRLSINCPYKSYDFWNITYLLYTKGPPDLQDLETSRIQICMHDAVVRCVPYQQSKCPWFSYADRSCARHANVRVLLQPWLSCTLTVLCEILILGHRVVKLCMRVTATTQKSGNPFYTA
jgi:hypothetical protein